MHDKENSFGLEQGAFYKKNKEGSYIKVIF
jgi:hypothetical protein